MARDLESYEIAERQYRGRGYDEIQPVPPDLKGKRIWLHRKARTRMAEIATAMVGHHYLHGGKGNRPGQNDGATVRQDYVKLDTDTKMPAPAFLAAYAKFGDGRYVCGGRYARLGGSPRSENDMVIRRYLAQQDPKNPGKCFTAAGLTPRKVKSGDKHPGPLVWGECCDGWRHFDCIGLIDFSLEPVSPKKSALRSVAQWASEQNTVGALSMGLNDEVWDADLVSVKDKDGIYTHIGILYLLDGQPRVVQAEETKIGVTTGKAYDPAKWNGGRWRLPDSMFHPDDRAMVEIPSSACLTKLGTPDSPVLA